MHAANHPLNNKNQRPAIQFEIKKGVLHYSQCAYKSAFVDDIDLAIHRLLAGEVVWILQSPRVIGGVQRTLEKVLKQPAREVVEGG